MIHSTKTASKQAKELGFKSLTQVQEIGGESQQTLGNWFKKQPLKFEIHLLGCMVKLKQGESKCTHLAKQV